MMILCSLTFTVFLDHKNFTHPNIQSVLQLMSDPLGHAVKSLISNNYFNIEAVTIAVFVASPRQSTGPHWLWPVARDPGYDRWLFHQP